MKTNQTITIFVAVLSTCILLVSFRLQQKESIDGKTLFISNCGACHAANKGIAGPPFQEIRKDYAHDWIFAMIRNHDSVCRGTDIRSRYLSAVWHNTRIYSTFRLSDEEITAILDYVDTRPIAKNYYRHRKMTNEELSSVIEYLNKVPVDTTVEVYMQIFDSVQHL